MFKVLYGTNMVYVYLSKQKKYKEIVCDIEYKKNTCTTFLNNKQYPTYLEKEKNTTHS